MKYVHLYDISQDNPMTYDQAIDFLYARGIDKRHMEYFIHDAVLKKVLDYNNPDMQIPENSRKFAKNINAAVRVLKGEDSKEKYEFKSVKYMPGEINKRQLNENDPQIFYIALFYLEHGDITDEQRKCLEKILIKSNGYHVEKIIRRSLLVIMLMIFLILGSVLSFVANGAEMNPITFILSLSGITLGIVACAACIHNYLVPHRCVKTLNRIAIQR